MANGGGSRELADTVAEPKVAVAVMPQGMMRLLLLLFGALILAMVLFPRSRPGKARDVAVLIVSPATTEARLVGDPHRARVGVAVPAIGLLDVLNALPSLSIDYSGRKLTDTSLRNISNLLFRLQGLPPEIRQRDRDLRSVSRDLGRVATALEAAVAKVGVTGVTVGDRQRTVTADMWRELEQLLAPEAPQP